MNNHSTSCIASAMELQYKYVVLLFMCFHQSIGVNPGLKLRITQNGLNYAATQALNSLHLLGEKIPDVHGSDHVAVGKVDYDITGISVTAFKTPKSAMSIQSGQGIHWGVTGCSAQLAGDWHYHYKMGFISIKDHGTFTVSISNAALQLGFTLGESKGVPTIRTTGCSASVAGVDVSLHGGASWLYKIFDHNIDSAFKKQMIKLLCNEATKAINVDANKALQKVKVILPIQDTGILDYSMLVNPIFASGYVDTYHKGEIYYKDHKDAPYTPAPFPETFDKSKMAYIWMSDYLLNTAGWALQKQNVLQYFFGSNDLKPDQRHLLNTTCPNNVCIGNFITKLQDFPGCTVSMNLSTSKPPTLEITPEHIIGHFEGDVVFYLNFPNKTTKYAFSAHGMANITLNVAMANQKITANASNFSPLITVTDSHIGNISGAGLTWTFKNVLTPKFILPQLNKIGTQGLDLPGSDQISYVNPTLKFVQNAVRLSTNLKWTPDFKMEEKKKEKNEQNVLRYQAPRKDNDVSDKLKRVLKKIKL